MRQEGRPRTKDALDDTEASRVDGDDHCKGRLGREAGDESDPVVDERSRRRRMRRPRQHVVPSVGQKPSSTMDRRDRKIVLGRR
jgi:hypothetical protein